MSTVLVTGSTGTMGRAVVPALRAARHRLAVMLSTRARVGR